MDDSQNQRGVQSARHCTCRRRRNAHDHTGGAALGGGKWTICGTVSKQSGSRPARSEPLSQVARNERESGAERWDAIGIVLAAIRRLARSTARATSGVARGCIAVAIWVALGPCRCHIRAAGEFLDLSDFAALRVVGAAAAHDLSALLCLLALADAGETFLVSAAARATNFDANVMVALELLLLGVLGRRLAGETTPRNRA